MGLLGQISLGVVLQPVHFGGSLCSPDTSRVDMMFAKGIMVSLVLWSVRGAFADEVKAQPNETAHESSRAAPDGASLDARLQQMLDPAVHLWWVRTQRRSGQVRDLPLRPVSVDVEELHAVARRLDCFSRVSSSSGPFQLPFAACVPRPHMRDSTEPCACRSRARHLGQLLRHLYMPRS